jgi:hypothetical protein
MGIINSFIGNGEGTLTRQIQSDVKIRAADLRGLIAIEC